MSPTVLSGGTRALLSPLRSGPQPGAEAGRDRANYGCAGSDARTILTASRVG